MSGPDEPYRPDRMVAVPGGKLSAWRKWRIRIRYAKPGRVLRYIGKRSAQMMAMAPAAPFLVIVGVTRALRLAADRVDRWASRNALIWLHKAEARVFPGLRAPWHLSQNVDLRDDAYGLRVLDEEGVLNKPYARQHARVTFE